MKDDKKNILALDTAMSGCSVSILSGGKVCTETRNMPHGQAEHLVPMIQRVIEKARIGFKDLDAIITTNGPGAFTGLRIGMATAKAFGLALNIPVWGITTLQALALAYVQTQDLDENFTVLVETRRRDFYVQHFGAQCTPLSEPASKTAEDILKNMPSGILIGDAVDRFSSLTSEKMSVISGFDLPDTSVIARGFSENPAFYKENPEPLYLRVPDVSLPKKKLRVLEGSV